MTDQDERASRGEGRPAGRALLVAVKAIHTVVWLIVESSMLYLLVAGLIRRTDRRAAIAGAIVAGESLIFAANKFRCPLTGVAESLGAEHGSVTDIYLPTSFAKNLPVIHAPLIVLAVFLHARNLRNRTTSCEERSKRLRRIGWARG